MGILKRPMKLIRNMETSNYGSSNYGSSTVFVISWLNCKHTLKPINCGGKKIGGRISEFFKFRRKKIRQGFSPKFLDFNVHESGNHTLIFEQA